MADLYAVPGETLTGIADAIRSKTGSDDFMTVSAMAAAIESISGGGDPNLIHRQYVLNQDTLNAKIDMPEIIGGAYLIMLYADIPARPPTVGTRCSKGGIMIGDKTAYFYGNSNNTDYSQSSSTTYMVKDETEGNVTIKTHTLLSGTYDIIVFKK